MTMYELALMRQVFHQRMQTIAFIGVQKRPFVTQDRLTGYESASKQHQLPIDTNLTTLRPNF